MTQDRVCRMTALERWIMLSLSVVARDEVSSIIAAELLSRVLRAHCRYAAVYDATMFATAELRGRPS